MHQRSLSAEAVEAQIRQARRMEIVGQLTGGIVHDFNNILTVISGTIEILQEAVADRADLAAVAGLIAEAAARGASMTSNLLAFAHSQPSRPRPVDVNALLVDAARLLRPTLGEHIEIDTRRATEAPFVLVDPNLLMTAILNLAVIARDAMPDGGTLTFETRTAVSQQRCFGAEDGITAANDVMIAVNATGHGVSVVHSDRSVADLGMIEDFIRQSDGHIDVRNEGGRGMSVSMYLPRTTGLVQPLAESGGEIDLLFTDVMMPGLIGGRQLAIEALNRRPSLKVLYTSGYEKNAMVQDGRLDSGVLLLAKPYGKLELAEMIRTALGA